MSPRDMRLLRSLVEEERVFVRDLRSRIGSLNPAQNALSLRNQEWRIQTDYIGIHDRDGVLCRPGYYWMEESERERARIFLEKAERAAATAPSAKLDISARESNKTSNSKDTIGGKG
ncbi:MAG: hypothetical protein K1060chlam2_01024 [Chlamydiae bacterium]|nr:hypothetical protein [Chlamydiota bacterium]